MRILYVFPENIGRPRGGTLHVTGMARALQTLGHEVTILAPKYFRHVQAPAGLSVRFVRLPGRSVFSYFIFQLAASLIALRYCLTHRVDGMIVRGALGLMAGVMRTGRALNVPSIYEVNGVSWVESQSRNSSRWFSRVCKLTEVTHARSATAVVGVTQAIADAVQRASGVSPERVFEVRNGANPSEFEPCQRPVVRQKLGLGAEHFAVGLPSSFAPWHGILELIRACALLSEEVASCLRVFLIGDGELRSQAEGLIAQLGLQRIVQCLETMERRQLAETLVGLDLGLFLCGEPGKLEYPGSPLKFFEYLAAGLPVMVTDDSHIGPLVRNHSLGMVIPNARPATIADGLAEAIGRREQLLEVGRRNRLEAQGEFSWVASARSLVEVFAATASRTSHISE